MQRQCGHAAPNRDSVAYRHCGPCGSALRFGLRSGLRSATISACEKGQQWITAVSLLREMQEWNMEADVVTYRASSLLDVLNSHFTCKSTLSGQHFLGSTFWAAEATRDFQHGMGDLRRQGKLLHLSNIA